MEKGEAKYCELSSCTCLELISMTNGLKVHRQKPFRICSKPNVQKLRHIELVELDTCSEDGWRKLGKE